MPEDLLGYSDLSKLNQIKIPRHLGLKECVNLNVLTDASKLAYGAVAYLFDGENSKLILSKARVAPIKELTLPQMELMVFTLGN